MTRGTTGSGRFWVWLSIVWLVTAGSATAAPAGPIAGPGPNQRVDAGAKVILAGNGRVAEGRIVRFLWTQTGGPRVALRNSTRSTADFTAPAVKAATPLKFRLTVTDNKGRKGSGVVTITVVPRGQPSPVEPPPAGSS